MTLQDYPQVLKDDPVYRDRAAQIVARMKDPVELIGGLVESGALKASIDDRIAVQTPCSMQHGLGLNGYIESILGRIGAEVVSHRDAHLWWVAIVQAVAAAIVLAAPEVLWVIDIRVVIEPIPIMAVVGVGPLIPVGLLAGHWWLSLNLRNG